MMEALSRIRRYDLIGLGNIQCLTYPSTRWRKIIRRIDPMNRKIETRKIFQHRRLYQSRLFCSSHDIGSLYSSQRSGTFLGYQHTVHQVINTHQRTKKSPALQRGFFYHLLLLSIYSRLSYAYIHLPCGYSQEDFPQSFWVILFWASNMFHWAQ